MGRIVDLEAVRAARKSFCAVCGSHYGLQVHHIVPRSRGGGDVPGNLITLCFECHAKVHEGKLSLSEAFASDPPPLEAVEQAFAAGVEMESEGKWTQAAAVVVMLEVLRMKPKDVSSRTGLTPAMVREMARTFLAFPNPETRAADLSFSHHRYAARTSDPEGWLEKALKNGWSSRQLCEAIKRASAVTEKSSRDISYAKAEKAVRLAREVLSEGGEAAGWLSSKIQELLKEKGRAAV